jgi:hypothetical protein
MWPVAVATATPHTGKEALLVEAAMAVAMAALLRVVVVVVGLPWIAGKRWKKTVAATAEVVPRAGGAAEPLPDHLVATHVAAGATQEAGAETGARVRGRRPRMRGMWRASCRGRAMPRAR